MPIRLTPPAPSPDAPGRSPAQSAAGALMLVQALVLVGAVAFYIYEIAIGASDDVIRAVMSTVLIALFAVGLGLLARGWLQGSSWPRTGTIVWCVLLLPVTLSLFQSGRPLWAAFVGVLAVGTIAAAFAATPDPD